MIKINNIERQKIIVIIINVNSSLYKEYTQANKFAQEQNSLRLNIQWLITPN